MGTIRDVIPPQRDATIQKLLAASGGKPVIQIVFDPETDRTSISSVGFDHAKIPGFVLTLGRVLTGEIDSAAASEATEALPASRSPERG